jgi:hypothetical protein
VLKLGLLRAEKVRRDFNENLKGHSNSAEMSDEFAF